jgi:hypothetical protein
MTTRFTINTAALLTLSLILAACASGSEPATEAEEPLLPTAGLATVAPATEDQPPATGVRPTATSERPTATSQPPTPSPQPPTATPALSALLPDLGPAPDITNEAWLNTDQPLNLELLKGEVVLVEFWTFG